MISDEVLSDGERATVRALAETLITPGEIVPPVDDGTVTQTEQILPHFPPFIISMYRVALRGLDAASVARYGKPFAKLDSQRRLSMLDRADEVGGSIGRTGIFALGAPIKMAHFGRRDYLDRLGIPDYRNDVNEPVQRWMTGVTTPEELDPDSRVECDVVVIGTGAGGGAVAASLAERGLTVVMVEEGRYQQRGDFNGPPQERILRFWRDGGMNLTVGNTAIGVPIGRMVGGTTAINSGTCFRTPDAILDEWLRAGFPSDFEPTSFGPLLDRVERELHVTPGDPKYLGKIAHVVAKGATELGGNHGPLNRNAPGCTGQGVCVAGCPTGAKLSSDVTWVRKALKAGALLYRGLAATEILKTG